jgi:hypothetical protein
MATVNGISTYSRQELQATAHWTLRTHNCPECCANGVNHRLTLKEWYLQLQNGQDTRLGIIGECTKHHYRETMFCCL